MEHIESAFHSEKQSEYVKQKSLKEKSVWKVQDVADFLGYSKKTVYIKAASGDLPSFKKGKFRYFIPLEVENWLLEGDQ